ncbi:hypothetical protein pb186bvf_003419 [Paramecium bursaria]
MQLPKIVYKQSQLTENPFYVPDEQEIFKMKEKEKFIKKEEREKIQSLKVHEKGTKQKGQFTIRKINQIGEDDEFQDKDTQAKLNIVDAADSAVKNRVRQKEPMYQFIDKKREMLLFQMLIDHKRGMIDEFEQLTALHKQGLQKSEQLLEEDLELFNRFLEENKDNSRKAIKEAELETKEKQLKLNEIKQLAEKKTDQITKNIQKIDILEDYWKYKKFLDKITPKDFFDEKKQRQKAKKQVDLEKYAIEKYAKLYPNYNINTDIIELIEESDEDFETYFKHPYQLEEIFQGLEERNLFLIANTKEIEQTVDELKQRYELKKQQLGDKYQIASQSKADLLRQIEQVNIQINNLKSINSQSDTQDQLKSLENQITMIYKQQKEESAQETRKDITGVEMLKEMERVLEVSIKQIKTFRQFNSELVLDKEKEQIKKKKDQQKLVKQQLDQEEQKRKQEEQQKEMTVQVRLGRPIMVRSWPPQKRVEVKEPEINEEERDRLKYFT